MVSRCTPHSFHVDTMGFPGGHHMVSNVDIMWFPGGHYMVSPHGFYMDIMWCPGNHMETSTKNSSA